jgi:SAM-dependent methyltransferase
MAVSTERDRTRAAPPPREAPGEQQGGEHEGVAVDGPLQAMTRSKREVPWTRRRAATLPCMAGCCPSRDYRRIFNQRFARRLANRYGRRGLDPTAERKIARVPTGSAHESRAGPACPILIPRGGPRPWRSQTMVQFLRQLGLEGASVLEIGGGGGELEIELLKAGAARAQNLELSPAYEQQARTLAAQAGVQGRLDWRLHDLAVDPGVVATADLVVLHRVVCCYPDYERLLAAAADHARRALVFSYPPRNLFSRAFYGVFNLVMRLTRSSFRGFAHPPGAMLAVLEDRGLRPTFQHRGRVWQVAGLVRAS